MTRWMLLLLFGLASCTAPEGGLPVEQSSADDPAVVAEQAIEQQLSYDAYLKDAEMLWRVGDKLEVANADLCRAHTGYAPDFHVLTLAMTDEYQRSGAIARFPDMAKAATVVYADPGSAAEQSGIRPDDLVVSVNDSPIPADARAQAVLTAVFAQSGKTPARVTLKRAGQNVTVTVPGALACSYPIEAVDSDKINSYTDATGIYINKGMIALLHSDDELAVILGHEMGHNISGQIEAGLGSHIELALGGKAAIIPLEEEADYVGLYAMARAGYEINAAPALWRRLAAVVMPEAITEASDHPIFPVRVVMLKKEIAEINAKVARGAALLPETGGASGVAPVAAAVGGR